jgi:hypothetical protein
MGDLYNNPLVNNALKALTPDQLDAYKKFGQSLYGTINYEDSTIVNNIPAPIEESVAYIEEGLKAGIDPSDLSEDEVVILQKAYGEEWYLKYGFTKEEVPEPGLSLQMKKDIDDAIEKKIADALKKREKREKRKKK